MIEKEKLEESILIKVGKNLQNFSNFVQLFEKRDTQIQEMNWSIQIIVPDFLSSFSHALKMEANNYITSRQRNNLVYILVKKKSPFIICFEIIFIQITDLKEIPFK